MTECLEFHELNTEKDPVMWNSAVLCCLIFVWVLLLNPGLREARALLSDGGPDRTLKLEALKATLLEFLGMDRPPKSRGKISYQDQFRLYHQYRNLRGNIQHQRGSSLLLLPTVQSLNGQQHHNQTKLVQWLRAVFHREPNITEEFTLGRARLQLHTQPTGEFRRLNRKIAVQIQTNSSSHIVTILTTDIFRARGHSVTMDVTAAVEKWLTQTNDTLFVVDIGLHAQKQGRPKTTAQLILELEKLEGTEREIRSAIEDDGRCSRKPLSVSFEEIGWSNWIVAPAGYTMFFCEGSCPHNYRPASMHTQVKSRLHRLTKGAIPHPCCVPAAYEPIILMHYDSRGKLKLTSFNDLIVSQCNCA